jgi:hypothetical protein
VYHTNRAAAYLERVWELKTAAAANKPSTETISTSTKKLIVELDPAGTTDSRSSSSSKDVSELPSSWLEVGGSLDGMQLDSSAESLGKQLDAAVLDCRAALQLVPGHAKAHYRWANVVQQNFCSVA